MSLEVDHLILCVPDLDEAGARLNADHGLASIPGGRHPGHGTANRIVPLGVSYLELLTVVDPAEAQSSHFGRWAQRSMKASLEAHGLVLRTRRLDAVCARLDLNPVAMKRARPDGTEMVWRLAGMKALVDHGLPAFIEWRTPEDELPGRTSVDHEVDVVEMRVTLSGDSNTLRRWTEGAGSIDLVEGDPGVHVDLVTDRGTISI